MRYCLDIAPRPPAKPPDEREDEIMTETAQDASTESVQKNAPVDISYLANVKPKVAKIVPVARGRQAKPNPVASHYQTALENPTKGYSLEVSAGEATAVERYLRNAATAAGGKNGIHIQIQTEKNGGEDGSAVIALDKVKELDAATPVWVAFQWKEKTPRPERAEAPAEDALPAE